MTRVQQGDHYQVLGVPRNATTQQIEWAYKKKMAMLDRPALTRKTTPSLTSLQEQIEQVREAYQTLVDQKRRVAYNRWLGVEENAASSASANPRPAASAPPPSGSTEKPATPPRTRKPQSVYLDFFGFNEKPFDLTPDPKYLYLSAKHKEVLAHLVFGLQENNGFLKIVGEVGTGKTTIIRSFLRELREGFHFAYIFHPCVNGLELLQSINEELGLPSKSNSKKELIHDLRRFLLMQRQLNHRVVVIIDEAQNLDTAVLEELRLLSNLETETEKLIQIVLIGQPELEALLSRPELRQLKQRITIQWELKPLNLEETRGYIQHRLNVAGGKGKIRFEKSAVDLLFRYTQGIPRLINVMADRALLIAYTLNTKRISSRVIREAARDIGGLEPASNLKTAAWKVLVPGLALAGMLYWGFDSWIDFQWPPPAEVPDLRAQIRENPIDLGDPGDLIPAPPAAQSPVVRTPPAPPPKLEAPDPAPAAVALPQEAAVPTPPPAQDGVITLTQTGQLVTYLSSLTLQESQAEAARWVLERWGVLPQNLRRLDGRLDQIELEYGLSLHELNATFDKLATFNQPALLEVTLPEAKGTKYIALLSLKNGRGVFGSVDKLEIPLSVIEPLWTHRALVIWRDFERLPEMSVGFRGREAVWLQKNLRLLGFFKGREAPTYGPKTERAVQAFQRRYGIADHGRFDVESRILLYNLLSIYETPQLDGA